MKIVPAEKIYKDLVLGLIYPAVLGNIIYLLIKVCFEQVNIIIGGSFQWNRLLLIKLIILFITLVFYFCDYLYITFTNDFRKMFFFFDMVFILALFWTIYLIHIDNPDEKLLEPTAWLILLIYAGFMLLYFIWDWSEKNKSENQEEVKLYKHIIIWEICSIIGLLICSVITYKYRDVSFINNCFFIPLIIVTAFFVKFTYEKREFYTMPETATLRQEIET